MAAEMVGAITEVLIIPMVLLTLLGAGARLIREMG